MTTNSNSPLFSIITVTRNNLDGLRATHDSLKAQDCTDYEWIVIDGASSDTTADFLKTCDADWLSEPDNGIYDAMNKGIAKARGTYLWFMNAGDTFFDQNTLTHIKKLYEEQEIAPEFIYGDAHIISRDGSEEHKQAKLCWRIDYGMVTSHQAMLYRASELNALTYNTAYKVAADYEFTLLFLRQIETALYVPVPICRFKAGGLSYSAADLGRKEEFRIRRAEGFSLYDALSIYVRQFVAWQYVSLRSRLRENGIRQTLVDEAIRIRAKCRQHYSKPR